MKENAGLERKINLKKPPRREAAAVAEYKLCPPPSPSHKVDRPHLLRRLDDAMSRHITVVAAPAGYGKTALLTDWSGQQHGRVAWLSLEPRDDDPGQLVAGICAAFQVPVPKQKIPSGASVPSEDAHLGLVPLLSRLAGSGPSTLILDDAHWLTNRATIDVLSFIVTHLPGNIHFVFSGREAPGLPMARLRAAGLVTYLGTHELRFSLTETEVLLNRRFDLGLPPETIRLIWEQTEGWCAGLRLAALALSESSERAGELVKDLGQASTEIGDYLLEEVFSRQSPDLQQFLLDTCLVDRLCPELCQALSGQKDGVSILESLVTRGLFTAVIDRQGRWFRFHRLFADFLRKQLRLHDPERVRKLHQAASTWFIASGFQAEGIEHALTAEDFEPAARLIAAEAPVMVLRGTRRRLLLWIDRLPATRVRPRRWLALSRAWALLLEGDFDAVPGAVADAVRLIRLRARQGVERAETTRLLGHVSAIAALRAAWQGSPKTATRHMRRAMRRLPAADVLTRATLAVSNTLHLPRDHRTLGDLEAASAALLKGARRSREAGLVEPALAVLHFQADLEIADGRLHDAEKTFREIQLLSEVGTACPTLIAGIGYAGYSELLYERNRLLDAERQAADSAHLAEHRQDMATQCQSQLILVKVAVARGDWRTAEVLLQRVEELAFRAAIAWLKTQAEVWWVRLLLRQGRPDKARRRSTSMEAQIRVCLTQSRPREAHDMLAILRKQMSGSTVAGWMLELDLLQAMAAQQLGDHQNMLEHIERTLLTGEREGHLRSFLDEGEALIPVLAAAAEAGIAPQYAGRLEKMIGDEAARPGSGGLLTRREQQLVDLVAKGLSNDQVSSELGIAYGTVKRHLHNVFNKLNLQSRAELIARFYRPQ